MTTHSLPMLAAAVAASMLATVASAAPTAAAATRTLTVSYADLDLSHDAGVERLYGRLRRAAARVCAEEGPASLVARGREQACVARALDAAVGAVHSSPLTALHQKADAGARPERLG